MDADQPEVLFMYKAADPTAAMLSGLGMSRLLIRNEFNVKGIIFQQFLDKKT